MGRGLQKKPIKGIRTDTPGKFLKSPEQKQVQLLKEALKRAQNKVTKLKAHRQTLIKSNRDLARALLSTDQPISLKNASAKLMESAIRNSLQFWTPLSITVAQLEQEYYVLNLAGVETMRNIQKNGKHKKKLIPARATIQRSQKKLTIAATPLSLPTINAEGDMVVLDAKTVIEQIIDKSAWPGFIPTDNQSIPTAGDMSSLPALLLDATTDGAELTSNRGMIIQGLKVISPELVKRLTNDDCLDAADHAPAFVPADVSAIAQAGGPSVVPAIVPVVVSSAVSSVAPSVVPAAMPSVVPSVVPAGAPSAVSSVAPSVVPAGAPSVAPVDMSSVVPAEDIELLNDTDMLHVLETVEDVGLAIRDMNYINNDSNNDNNNDNSSNDEVQEIVGLLASTHVSQADDNNRDNEVDPMYKVQSSRNVILTGFLHGSDNEIVNGEYNYNRYCSNLF